VAELTASCKAGTDCSNPDMFCDSDSIADVAVAAYVVHLDELRS
jgi:hypothetical protein